MSTTPTVNAGALIKPQRSNLTVTPVMSFKPPGFAEEDGEKKLIVVFVDERGNERRVVASPELWKLIDGNPSPGRRAAGLDGRDGRRRFWLYLEGRGAQQKAVSLTNFPTAEYMYSKATGVPENAPEDLILKIDAVSGTITVVAVPAGARATQVESVVRAIDKITEIYTGLTLAEYSEVLSVSGNQISCSLPPPTEDRGVGRQMI
jgi:hypothetical protein